MITDVTCPTSKISFIHHRKKNIRHVYLTVDKQNGVVLKSGPRLSTEEAMRIVSEKAEWIKARLASIHETVSPQLHDLQAYEYLIVGGYKLPLHLHEKPALKKPAITLTQEVATLAHPPGLTPDKLHHSVESFYKERTVLTITPMIERLSRQMELFPHSVSYRKYKRRWGCCDGKNRITFHSLLSQFSDDIIEYIVIHELAHIKEKNHSSRFWALVETHCPHYKAIHKKIKGNVDGYQ